MRNARWTYSRRYRMKRRSYFRRRRPPAAPAAGDLNTCGRVVFETNRYSVPVEKRKQLTLKAYPSPEIVADNRPSPYTSVATSGSRILDPLLPALAGAATGRFEARRCQWRETWPPRYGAPGRLAPPLSRPTVTASHGEQRRYVSLCDSAAVVASSRLVVEAIISGPGRGRNPPRGVTFCLHRLLDRKLTMPWTCRSATWPGKASSRLPWHATTSCWRACHEQ